MFCRNCNEATVYGECVNTRCPVVMEVRMTMNHLKVMATRMQNAAVEDKNVKRKALRTRAVQSMLRLAQSKVMRDLAIYGD